LILNESNFNSQVHHRRSTRLKEYDYSQAGAYFVTIVTAGRQCLLGEIADTEMRLNKFGEIVRAEWERGPEIRREVELGAFVVMPNHFHGIVILSSSAPDGADDVGATGRSPLRPYGPPRKSLSVLMAGFKSSVTKQINVTRNMPGAPVWQRNYYDHIIRNEKEMAKIWDYIDMNPSRWNLDEENPLKKQESSSSADSHRVAQ
jgi:putative transposase